MKLSSLMSAKPRTRRSRKFVPGDLGRESGPRLEARSLAAPTIFRLGTTLPEIVYSFVNGTNQPAVSQTSDTSTLVFGNSVVTAMNQTSSIITATSKTDTIDGGLTGDPLHPDHRNPVQGLTYSLLDANTPSGGVPGLANQMGTREVWARSYMLADDTIPPNATATLHETWDLSYSPSTGPGFGSNILVAFNSADGSLTPANNNTLSVNVVGGGNGITNTVINGDLMHALWGPGSTTYTVNNATAQHNASYMTATVTSTTAHIEVTTFFPNGLPNLMQIGNPNNITGIPWNVSVDARNNIQGNSGEGAHGTSTLATTYTAFLT